MSSETDIFDEDNENENEKKIIELTRALYEKNKILFVIKEVTNAVNSTEDFYVVINLLSDVIKLYLDADYFSIFYNTANVNGIYIEDFEIEEEINELLTMETSIEDLLFEINEETLGRKIFYYPLIEEKGKRIGSMIISMKLGNNNFDEHKETCVIIAGLISQAIEKNNYFIEKLKADIVENDLKFARKIQMSYIPSKFPEIENFQFAAFYSPARSVGGDYYDWFDLGNGKYSFVIGDVSGKGASAALFMVKARENFRIFSQYESNAEMVLRKINSNLAGDVDVDKFMSAIYFILDIEKKAIRYANAGHDPMIIVRNNEIIEMKSKNQPLGITDFVEYKSETLYLEKGDVLILYTDGVVEARNSKHEFFEFERFYEIAQKSSGLDAKEIVEAIKSEVISFSEGTVQHDDFAVMVIKHI